MKHDQVNEAKKRYKNFFYTILEDPKYRISSIMLFLLCFSASYLRIESRIHIYFILVMIIIFFAFLKIFIVPKRIILASLNSFMLWLLVLFWMYFFYALVRTSYAYFSVEYFTVMFVSTISIMILFIDIPRKAMSEIFIKACLISSLILCILIFINEWETIIAGSHRIGWHTVGNVNAAAAYLGVMSVPIIYKVIIEKKLLYSFPYLVVASTMLMTGSKKALLYILLSIVVFTIVKYRLKIYKYAISIIIMIAFGLLIFNNAFFYDIVGKRTIDFLGGMGFNIEDASYSKSTNSRMKYYELSFEAFAINPVFGGGWGFFSSEFGSGAYTHSNFTQILVAYGLFGFFIYYGMHLWLIFNFIKIFFRDNYAKMFLTMLIIILICDTSIVTFSFSVFYYLAPLFSYLYVMKERDDSNNKLV